MDPKNIIYGNPPKLNVFISLFSSFGDKISSLQQCVQILKDKIQLEIVTSTSFYEVEPQLPDSAWSICAVLQASTKYPPLKLFNEIKAVEKFMNSLYQKDLSNGSMHLPNFTEKLFAIDLLFYEDLVFEDEEICIPSPLVHTKASILVPLLEISPNLIHPKFDKTITKLYEILPNPEQVILYGTNV